MDIYEYAMKMEKDGEQFYREIAVKTRHKGLSRILTMLADAEVGHYRLFQNMKNHEKVQMTDSPILAETKNVFEQIREKKEFDVDVSQIDLYREAQVIEKKSRDFYLEKVDELKEASQKEIFTKIADEEKRHYFILENIINFVNKPNTWLENPEWYHLEQY
jgi:rubrerythrin